MKNKASRWPTLVPNEEMARRRKIFPTTTVHWYGELENFEVNEAIFLISHQRQANASQSRKNLEMLPW